MLAVGRCHVVLQPEYPPHGKPHHELHPYAPQVAAAARRALADISARQAAQERSLQDQAHQIRLLQESRKLARLRRASAVAEQRPA